MPIGDMQAFWEWAETLRPEFLVGWEVLVWLGEAGEEPWHAPSVPVQELSFADRETRYAELEIRDTRVDIFYLHRYETGAIEVVAIRSDPISPEAT